MHPLKYAYTFPLLKVLLDLAGSNLYHTGHFIQCLELHDLRVAVDQLDDATAALKLALKDFDSVADLHPQLRVVADSLEDHTVRQQIKLVRVGVEVVQKLVRCSLGVVNLETENFFEHWAHILSLQPVD